MTQELPEIPAGTVLAGKYRVERTLGQGGMGFVLAATHLELQQRVAIKFLNDGLLANTEAVVRFIREARAAARIRSEHVVRVIDVARLDDGAPYIVMEYLEGQDLSQLLRAGALPVEDAVEFVVQACHAVAEAHANGVVHRDLKPSNLFLTVRPDGTRLVKVLDFGISKLASEDGFDPQLTKTAAMMGTPLYMSPEQMRSPRDVDQRTDVWAMGCILYELLAGEPPFNGRSYIELVTAIASQPPASLVQARPQVSPQLEQVVLRSLVKDPAQRLGSMGELARELQPFAPRHSHAIIERVVRLSQSSQPPGAAASDVAATAPTPEAAPAAAPAANAGTSPPWSNTRPAGNSASPRGVVLGAAGIVAVGVAVGVGWGVTRQPAAAAPTASAPEAKAADLPKSAAVLAAPAQPTEIQPAAQPLASTAPQPPVAPARAAAQPPTTPRTAAALPVAAKPVLAAAPVAATPVTAAPVATPVTSSQPRKRAIDIGLK